ncbi:ABC transporter permease [Streptomyces sp. NBRC 109706]|uniref:ABC transporter permease n=1 Tax=Streptomyces sp. NBRC 109706 TaxID=1550035 RepID=UPI000782AA91|nr:ABC-2 family transporter protein [Streptomyces sp. NBRC 109706]
MRLRQAPRTARLYVRLLSVHLRAALEHESDFWVMVGAAIVTQLTSVVFLSAIFLQVPALEGWTFSDIVLMFALVTLAEGVVSLFFEGMWQLPRQINEGALDYFLVRPYPVVLQVTSAQVGLNGLGNLLSGTGMLVLGLVGADIDWSIGTVLVALVVFVSAMLVKIAISLASNVTSFWIPGPNPLFGAAMHQVGELLRFPLTIYPMAMRIVLGFVIPFAFVSFYPVTVLTGEGGHHWLGLLTPLVAAYCLSVALAFFRRGLRRYESAGH